MIEYGVTAVNIPANGDGAAKITFQKVFTKLPFIYVSLRANDEAIGSWGYDSAPVVTQMNKTGFNCAVRSLENHERWLFVNWAAVEI